MFAPDVLKILQKKIQQEKELNEFTFNGIGFANFIFNTVDKYEMNPQAKYFSFSSEIKTWLWLFSKIRFKKSKKIQKDFLLVPSDDQDFRMMQLFEPIIKELDLSQTEMGPINDSFRSLLPSDFLQCVFVAISNTNKIIRAFRVLFNGRGFSVSQKTILVSQFYANLLVSFAMLRYIKLLHPKVVLVGLDRHRYPALLVSLANSQHIGTATLVHGSIFYPSQFVPLIAKDCLCWGSIQAGFFESTGVDMSRIRIVGNPRFTFYKKTDLPVPDIKRKHGIDDQKKIILHASQNLKDNTDMVMIQSLLKGIKKINTEWQLVIRLHPSQNRKPFIDLVKDVPSVFLLEKETSVQDSLLLADAAVIFNSTFSIDAIFAGVPVVLLNPSGEIFGLAKDLIENADTKVFRNGDEFCDFLETIDFTRKQANEVFDLEGQEAFAKQYCRFAGKESAIEIKKYLEESAMKEDPLQLFKLAS